MRAFVDTIETKEQAIANLESIRASWGADRIIQCEYHFRRGCAVLCKYYSQYCSFGKDMYSQAERVHGIPAALVMLENEIFEGLSEAEAHEWPLQYLRAINVGSDLSQVTDKFILRILDDKEHGVIAFVKSGSREHSAVARVIELYRRKLSGENVEPEDWEKESENAAMSAHAAWWAATPERRASPHVAWWAARMAMELDHNPPEDATLEGHYLWMRDVLIDIIKNTI